MAENCKNCAHSVFDEQWGEYKCKAHHRRIKDIVKECKTCEDYEKKSNKK